MKLNLLRGVGLFPILSFSALLLGDLVASAPFTADSFNETFNDNDLVRRDTIDATTLANAKANFPKIDWDYAAGDCTATQFQNILEATFVGLEMMTISGSFINVKNTAGFNRFFMKSNLWTDGNKAPYRNNLNTYGYHMWNAVQKWPGDPPGKPKKPGGLTRPYYTKYACQDQNIGRVGYCAGRPNTAAFTIPKNDNSECENCAQSHSITFCPLFFTSRVPQMSGLLKLIDSGGTKYSPDQLGVLMTREHVIIHEWFHNYKIDLAGFHITDIADYVGLEYVAIYGADIAAAYAWKAGTTPMPNTLLNADSWAWMVSYNYFANLWGWTASGVPPTKRDLTSLDFDFENATDPTSTLLPREDEDTAPTPARLVPRQTDATGVDGDTIDGSVDPPQFPEPPDDWCVEPLAGEAACAYTDYDISDAGGCWLSPDCRYPNDDETVSEYCTCQCDESKGDGAANLVSHDLSDPMCTGWDGTGTGSGGGTPGGGGQQVGIAAYIPPAGDPDAWTRMTNYNLGKLSVLVVNALNGPDNTVNTAWAKVIDAAAGAGKTVIGYVRTGYLGQSTLGFTTRLGSNELADWVSQIEIDVDLWYSLYPGKISGIFFDEGWNSCGTNNQFSELYRLITENTKRKYPGAFTVLNPGATMPQCFENSADTLMTFESSYETYTNSYVDNGWTAESTQKIWHIIYNVPAGSVATVAALAKTRGAGFVQITDDTLPNPYDTLPNDSYMQTLLTAMEGGTVEVAEPESFATGSAASTPGGLKVTATDYSSVSLSWTTSANALSYKIYVNGVATLNLASYMTAVTVGNLAVGTSGFSFQISSVGGGGSESSLSGAVTASTISPPEVGKYVVNAQVSTSGSSTVYQADVLIPYAYVRVYITETIDGFCPTVGWTVNYSTSRYVCALAMIESGILYGYSGTTSGEWSWTNLGAVTVTQDHYHFTWNVPLGTDTLTTGNFVIQTEGYGPLENFLHPCPLFSESGTYCEGTYNGS